MRWDAQVRQLMAKDVRRNRLALAGFVGAIAVVSLATASSSSQSYPGQFQWIDILGGLLAASIVQDDSPLGHKASWRAYPLSGFAVFSAKLSLIAVIGAASPIAEHFARSGALGSGAPILNPEVATHAIATMAAVMILAALTPDLMSFVLAFVGYTLLQGAAGVLVPRESGVWSSAALLMLPILIGIPAIAATGALYLRDGERPRIAAALSICVLAIGASILRLAEMESRMRLFR
jgi:hypothetical protein